MIRSSAIVIYLMEIILFGRIGDLIIYGWTEELGDYCHNFFYDISTLWNGV